MLRFPDSLLLAAALPVGTVALRLGVATALGFFLGLGRERLHRAAGLRTHMLVALGAAMFVAGSISGGISVDGSARVIQGVVQGIGFLGAGTILKLSRRAEVHGLTTAASIWVTAAIGIACGLGEFAIACIGALLAWFTLVPLKSIERGVIGEDKHAEVPRPEISDDSE